MDDKLVREDVLDELEFDPSINATNIGVAVDEGVVTLTGHVSSSPKKPLRSARPAARGRRECSLVRCRRSICRRPSDDRAVIGGVIGGARTNVAKTSSSARLEATDGARSRPYR